MCYNPHMTTSSITDLHLSYHTILICATVVCKKDI